MRSTLPLPQDIRAFSFLAWEPKGTPKEIASLLKEKRRVTKVYSIDLREPVMTKLHVIGQWLSASRMRLELQDALVRAADA